MYVKYSKNEKAPLPGRLAKPAICKSVLKMNDFRIIFLWIIRDYLYLCT